MTLNKIRRNLRSNDFQESITDYVVGKNAKDPYSSITDALSAAGSVATLIKPVLVYVKPGQYYETGTIELPDNVILYGLGGIKQTNIDKSLLPSISGSFSKTGDGQTSIIGLKLQALSGSNTVYVNSTNDWTNENLLFSECVLTTDEDNDQVIEVDSGFVTFDNCTIIHKKTETRCIYATGSDTFIEATRTLVGTEDDSCVLINDGGTVSFYHSSLRGYISGSNESWTGLYNSWLVGEAAAPLTLIQLDSDSTVAVESSEINNDAGGGRFSEDGTYYIMGPVWRSDSSLGSSNTDIPQTIDVNLYNDCYINKFNADLCTIVKTSSGDVNLTRQNRVCIINKTSGAATQVNLPSVTGSYLGQEHIILDGKGDANSNNITISGSGATINGDETKVIAAPYGRLHVIYNGTQWNVFNAMTGSTVI